MGIYRLGFSIRYSGGWEQLLTAAAMDIGGTVTMIICYVNVIDVLSLDDSKALFGM